MRRFLVGIVFLLAATALAAPAPLQVVRAGEFESQTLSLPGFLVKSAAVNGPGGTPGVALLLASRKDLKGPKTLLFFDPARRTLQTLASNLHEEVNTLLGFDLAGDGALAPIAGMPGVLFTPAGGGTARKVLDQPAVDLRSVTGLNGPARPWIPAAHTGVLELLGSGPGGLLARRNSFPLPVRAERQRWGLRLVSPPVTLLPGDPPLFAVGPDEVGRRRLQTVLIPADGSPAVESWSLLPGEERLSMDRRYLRLDGRPVLAAVTLEKIGLLAKKRVRVFNLELDRSRKGGGPVFAAETDCPLWWPLDTAALDADGDGKQDLILAHPGGLRGREMQVTAYRGLGGGRFEAEPRRWKLNDEPTDWLYGPDLTGDAVPDLLLYVGDRLLLYPGDAKGSRPLAGRPLWSFAISGAPKKQQKGGDDEAPSGDEEIGPERERVLESLELPGGGRITLARGAQADGRTVLTLVRRSGA